MKRSKLLSVSILVALVLFLNVAKNVSAQPLRPSHGLPQQRNEACEYQHADPKQSASPTRAIQAPPANNSPNSQGGTEQIRDDRNQHANRLWQSWKWFLTWLFSISAAGFFNFIVAVATGVMAYFTYRLVIVTREMHKASQAAEEPYLGIGSGTLETTDRRGIEADIAGALGLWPPDIYGKLTDVVIEFSIKNVGKGVAKMERARARPHLSNERPIGTTITATPYRFRSIGIGTTDGAISPFDKTQAFIFISMLPTAIWSRVILRELRLRVMCSISYRDVFKRGYSERFWLVYEPMSFDFDTKKSKLPFVWSHPSNRRKQKKTNNTNPIAPAATLSSPLDAGLLMAVRRHPTTINQKHLKN